MSESNEPSYYEIALTNRQVLVSFVVLLTCVLAAFVSGVWVGRNGSGPQVTSDPLQASVEAAPGDLEKLEEFKFFSDQERGGTPPPASEPREIVTNPAPSPVAETPREVRTAPPPPRLEQQAPPPRVVPPPPPTPRPAPPPRATSRPAPTPATAAAEGLVIQVLSTRDEARAKRVLGQLKQGGYPAFLSPVQVGTQVNYRVRVGPYQDRAPAEAAAKEVNSKYKLDTWITAAGN